MADNKITFCNGRIPLKSCDWWVPNRVKPEDFTYCNWCVENGCIDKSEVTKLQDKEITCNCDCPTDHENRPIVLICTTCKIKFGYRYINQFDDIFLKDEIVSTIFSTNKQCRNCSINNNNNCYCDFCSYTTNHCAECGENLKNGDEYISDAAALVERISKRLADSTPDKKPTNQLIRKGSMNYFYDMLKLVKEKYAGNNISAVREILIASSKQNRSFIISPQDAQKIIYKDII